MTGTDGELKEKLLTAIKAQETANNTRLADGGRNFSKVELLGVYELDRQIESIRTELASRKCHKRTAELRGQIKTTLEELSKPKPRVCPPTPVSNDGRVPTDRSFSMDGLEVSQITPTEAERAALWPAASWYDDTTKRQFRELGGRESLRSMIKAQAPGDVPDESYPLGSAIRGRITGKYPSPEFRDLAGTINVLGGVAVPDGFSASVIDAARNVSVCMKAGARTIPMGSDTLSMARVVDDGTVEGPKAENVAFAGSDMDFDRILFTAGTYGILLKASNELLADSPNAAAAIEQSLAGAMAAKIDSLILDHIIASPEAGTEAAVGAIAWEDFLAGMETCELANAVPNAYVVNPAIRYDLRSLVSGAGATAAKLWLDAPPGVAALLSLTTNSIALANAIVGDFTQAMLGVRTNVEIRISDVADDALAKYQTAIRMVWRGDVGLSHGNAFTNLTGITS